MKTVTYTHKKLNQTYELSAEKMTLPKAWSLLKMVCAANGWNFVDAQLGNIKVKVS